MTWVVSPTLSKAQRQKDFLGNAKSLADVKPKSGPPLDYSFREITHLSEILEEEPNSGRPKSVPPLPGEAMKTELNTVALRLSNNSIPSLEGLPELLEQTLDKPDELAWLDLSFNELTSIDDLVLQYPNLSVLYLHANKLGNIKQVKKLARLPRLSKLTLHGNPMEELNHPNYRTQVLAFLPNLKSLDFIGVTKVDREKANVWTERMKHRQR